jgi:uncharacterized membrane protein YdjX (TVP38/TMEM64 family)
MKNKFTAWFPFTLLAIACGLFFYFGLTKYLQVNLLRHYQVAAQLWLIKHYYWGLLIYNGLFTALIACGIPCASVFALVGGFLFGASAILYAIASTVGGGTILYFCARASLGNFRWLKSKAWLLKIEQHLKSQAFTYILMLRLVPVFPCWISNIGAGLFKIPFLTFFTASIIGVSPATIIYVLAGRSLDTLLKLGENPLSALIQSPSLYLPLLGLILLSLIPLIYKIMIKR